MSIRIFLFLWILLLPNIAQADSKVSAMTEDTTPSGTDLLYTVKDPATTPVSRRSTIRNVTEAGFNNAITANGTNIGVGTEDPQAKLDVNGAIYGRSNVGIGTAAPAAGLQVGPGSSSLGATLSSTGALIKGNLEVDGKIYGDGSLLTNTPIPSGVVTSVTGTYPVASTGGTAPVISVDLTPYPQNTRTISTTPPLYGGGNLSADRIIYETRAGPATDGYLAATDWVTFNAKQPAGSYLTAESDPLALAKFGTLNTGKWCSSNGSIISCTEDAPGGGSVTSVTASAPVASSGGTTPNITISQASGSTNGYLSSGDWTTFNSKQAAGSYLTGVSTVHGLTGAGTIASPLQVDPTVYTPGGSQWITSGINIYYNTGNVGIGSTAPQAALDLGTGTLFAGSGNFNGSGPTIIYEGLYIPDGNIGIGTTAYQVAGIQVGSGAQALSAPLGETSALIRGNLEVDGKIYGDGSQLTNLPAGSGTVTSVTGSSPISSSGGTTPNITIAQSGSGTNGYLSSADWNTFNNKQPAGSYLTSESDTLETVTGRGASSTNNIGLGTTAPATTLQVGTGAKALSATLPSGSALVKGNLEVDGKIYGDGSGLTNIPSGGLSSVSVKPGLLGDGTPGDPLEVDGTVYPTFDDLTSLSGLTDNYILRALGTTNAENSIIFDDGANIGISTNTPSAKLEIQKVAGASLFMISSSGSKDGDYLIVTSTGNVGMGTTSPTANLHIGTGAKTTAGTITSGSVVVRGRLFVDGGIYGGLWNANITWPNSTNTKGGWNALLTNTTEASNTAFGYNAMRLNDNDINYSFNTAIGAYAHEMGGGIQNTAVGAYALGDSGFSTELYSRYNTGVGMWALVHNLAGDHNTAVGWSAGDGVIGHSYSYNTTIGSASGYNLSTGGDYNSLLGAYSAYNNTSGAYNVCGGTYCIYTNTTGSKNTCLGDQCLYNTYTTDYNTALGYFAGGMVTDTTQNLYLGANTTGTTSSANEVVIGYGAAGIGSNSIAIGNSSITKSNFTAGNVGIGSTAPRQALDVVGSVYVSSNVSALSFTDRTPGYTGNALEAISTIKTDGKGNIDHATLPDFVKVHRDGQDERSLGAMITLLTKAVQELQDENERIKEEIESDWIKQFNKYIKEMYGNIIGKKITGDYE